MDEQKHINAWIKNGKERRAKMESDAAGLHYIVHLKTDDKGRVYIDTALKISSSISILLIIVMSRVFTSNRWIRFSEIMKILKQPQENLALHR